jgi:hypothetical protein
MTETPPETSYLSSQLPCEDPHLSISHV